MSDTSTTVPLPTRPSRSAFAFDYVKDGKPPRAPNFFLCPEMVRALDYELGQDAESIALRRARLDQLAFPNLDAYWHAAYRERLGNSAPDTALDVKQDDGTNYSCLGCCSFTTAPSAQRTYSNLHMVPLLDVGVSVPYDLATALPPTWEVSNAQGSSFVYAISDAEVPWGLACELLFMAAGFDLFSEKEDLSKISTRVPTGEAARWNPSDGDRVALVQWNPHLNYPADIVLDHVKRVRFPKSYSRVDEMGD